MALTAMKIRQAKASEKPYKLYDERGLFLLVNPSGSKLWRFKYRYGGKEKQLSLGRYPDVSLSEARTGRNAVRQELVAGVDPSAARHARRAVSDSSANSFEVVANEWFAKFSPSWAKSHSSKVIRRLERDIFPQLGKRPVNDIGARELLEVLRKIESRGALETAHRAKQNCGQVFRYAIATGRADRDPSADLRGALPPPIRTHHPTITDPVEVGALLRAIDGYKGSQITKQALSLAPLVFVRPGELRGAEWTEVSLDRAEWRIPSVRMKMRSEHIVPLSTQSIEILSDLKDLTGRHKYLFPSLRSRSRCMSENTVNAALRRLGYASDEMTGHGFRSMASTLLNEQGWNGDVIERQLAHIEKNSIRAAYNYAQYLPERRKMMQHWASYLDDLKSLSLH